MSKCVCGSGLLSDDCCAPILAGASAPTAEALMRSRYTAYVQGNLDYIERTCAPEALADFDRLDAEHFMAQAEWKGLDILQVVDGGPDDETGIVEFVFHCTHNGQSYTQHEKAEFCRANGAWLYKNSEVNPKTPPQRVEKIGRNDPCVCGSNKKYKKCCGA